MGQSSLRKGLGNWDAVKDAAMGDRLESSVDLHPEQTFNDQVQSGTTDFLSHKMRMQPRSSEAGVLDKINDQVEKIIDRYYQDIDVAVDEFFTKVESLSKMEPGELERTILAIQKVVYHATDVVTSLYQDAYFADRVQQDEYWQAYRSDELPSKATIGDRQAHAYEKSRDARFYYYWTYLTWKRIADKLSTLKDLQKTLEWFRSRTQKDRYA